MRVLVVDDEPAIRHALERALRRRGFEVVSASGGDSAYTLLSETPIDLVLLDVRMPQVSGDALFLAIVRRWPHLRDRVILMSGHPYAVEEDWPAELRHCPLLAKPFNLDLLFQTIDSVLRATAVEPPRRHNGHG